MDLELAGLYPIPDKLGTTPRLAKLSRPDLVTEPMYRGMERRRVYSSPLGNIRFLIFVPNHSRLPCPKPIDAPYPRSNLSHAAFEALTDQLTVSVRTRFISAGNVTLSEIAYAKGTSRLV